MKHSLEKRLLHATVAAGLVALAMPAMANEHKFDKMDVDGDGTITSVESANAARDMHDSMDGDGDGRVTAAELKASHEAKAREKGKTIDKDAAHYNDKLREMDENEDGGISAEEYAATAREMHDEGDANDDGNVTRAEFDAAMDRKKAGHKGTGAER